MGLTTALRLAEQGASVTVLDRQSTGREASWAGAGMLPPGNLPLAQTPEARLRAYSASLWPEFTQRLLLQTGIDNGYRVCGAVQLATAETRSELLQQLQSWQAEGLRVQTLQRPDVEQHVPGLHAEFTEAWFLPDFAQVRNPRHLHALKAACQAAGVRLAEHVQGLQLVRQQDRIPAVVTETGRFQFQQLCITAGAWSTGLLQSVGVRIPVVPVRGQIVQLHVSSLPFRCVMELGRRYLVPRPDGLILIGSTEERVGFVRENTVEGVTGLLDFASRLVPALRTAGVARMWAGLRPGSPDELPLLGPVPGLSNVYVGTGHFRSGLQMSPGTAAVLADLLLNRTPAIALDGFGVDRFGVDRFGEAAECSPDAGTA